MVDKTFEVAERERVLAVTKAQRFPCTSLLPIKRLFRLRNMNIISLIILKNDDKFDGFIPFFLFLSFQFSDFFSCLFYW